MLTNVTIMVKRKGELKFTKVLTYPSRYSIEEHVKSCNTSNQTILSNELTGICHSVKFMPKGSCIITAVEPDKFGNIEKDIIQKII